MGHGNLNTTYESVAGVSVQKTPPLSENGVYPLPMIRQNLFITLPSRFLPLLYFFTLPCNFNFSFVVCLFPFSFTFSSFFSSPISYVFPKRYRLTSPPSLWGAGVIFQYKHACYILLWTGKPYSFPPTPDMVRYFLLLCDTVWQFSLLT